jgi:hypothetical protein
MDFIPNAAYTCPEHVKKALIELHLARRLVCILGTPDEMLSSSAGTDYHERLFPTFRAADTAAVVKARSTMKMKKVKRRRKEKEEEEEEEEEEPSSFYLVRAMSQAQGDTTDEYPIRRNS